MSKITFSAAGVAMSRAGETDSRERSSTVVPTGATFEVKSGFYEGLEVAIDRDWIVIGRGRSADAVFAEPTISRAHAAIGYEVEGFYVQDLGSTNGTQVNRAKTERQMLKSGDEIRMGRLVIGLTLPA